MPTVQIIASPVTDRTCEKINLWAEKFFADPKNQKAYEVWHKKQYGCLPNEIKGELLQSHEN